MRFALRALCVLLLLLLLLSFHAESASLSFEDRLAATTALERVYYKYRLWPKENPGKKPAFEELISQQQLREKVELSLLESAALDQYWHRPLTSDQLQAELNRMIRNSKDPDKLQELFAALHFDPFLIAECIVRPVVAD